MRKIAPDIQIGDIFDDMIVVKKIAPSRKYGNSRYLIECLKCGRRKEADRGVLLDRKGTTHRSCGKGLKLKDVRFYSIWQNMRTRTTNEKSWNYKYYGGRGVNSDAFKYFIDFFDTMYESYKEAYKLYGNQTSLERIDVNGNYEPSNCIWIPMIEQHENTRRNVYFVAKSPTGQIYLSRNQRAFARDHGLNDKCISDCLRGLSKSHYGWKFSYIEIEDINDVTTNPTGSLGRTTDVRLTDSVSG